MNNFKDERKKFIRDNFPIMGIIIINILGISGMIILYQSGIFYVKNFSMMYDCFYHNGIPILFGTFFTIIFFYLLLIFVLNVLIPPKMDLLYLYDNSNNPKIFVNKRGKKFEFYDTKITMENGYYKVWRTHDHIYKIINKTNANWKPFLKRSYWLNFYSPYFIKEDRLLLPIIYLWGTIGLFALIFCNGYAKLTCLLFLPLSIFFIVYDLVYKIKLKKDENYSADNTKIIKFFDNLLNFLPVVAMFCFSLFFTYFFNKAGDNTTRLILGFFVICSNIASYYTLAKSLKNDKLEKVFLKIYSCIFLLFWFGMIGYLTFSVIILDLDKLNLLITVPFWFSGFLTIYKVFIEGK